MCLRVTSAMRPGIDTTQNMVDKAHALGANMGILTNYAPARKNPRRGFAFQRISP